jgi:hypothetical protein
MNDIDGNIKDVWIQSQILIEINAVLIHRRRSAECPRMSSANKYRGNALN